MNAIREVGRFIKASKDEKIILLSFYYEVIKLYFIVKKNNKKENKMDFQSKLFVVSIIKNEALYIKEWIEYHRLVGVDKFIIYDNNSTDDIMIVLKKYIEDDIVEYHKVAISNPKLHHPQKEMYTDAILKHRLHCKWMAFIDIDEFIVPEKENNIKNVLETLYASFNDNCMAGVAINWLNYGSSFHKSKPDGLVIENYTWRSKDSYEWNQLVKTIANPRLLVEGGIHQPKYYGGFYGVNELGKAINRSDKSMVSHKYIRINHYASKSKEEAEERQERNFGGSKLKRRSHDINEIEDLIMQKYIDQVKDRMIDYDG